MSQINVKQLGLQPYLPMLEAMQQFTATRDTATTDELWLLEHQPVFTLGQAGKAEHILTPHDIPVIKTDRGGQVTYHAPGQLMAYCLLDVKRLQLNSRQLVCLLEKSIINLLADFHIQAYGDRDAPGVYVAGAKIASLGLRLRKGYSYHGLCLNVNADLTPFTFINPCGIKNQAVTSLKNLGCDISVAEVGEHLANKIKQLFYNNSSV